MIPCDAPYYFFEVEQEDEKIFGYELPELKGYLFKLLSQEAKENPGLLDEVYENPDVFGRFLEKHRKESAQR